MQKEALPPPRRRAIRHPSPRRKRERKGARGRRCSSRTGRTPFGPSPTVQRARNPVSWQISTGNDHRETRPGPKAPRRNRLFGIAPGQRGVRLRVPVRVPEPMIISRRNIPRTGVSARCPDADRRRAGLQGGPRPPRRRFTWALAGSAPPRAGGRGGCPRPCAIRRGSEQMFHVKQPATDARGAESRCLGRGCGRTSHAEYGRERDAGADCATRTGRGAQDRQTSSSLALNEMVRGVSMPSNSTS